MHGRTRIVGAFVALGLSFSVLSSSLLPFGSDEADASESRETDYIIQVPEDERAELMTTLTDLGVNPDYVYDEALTGVAVALTPSELSAVSSSVLAETISPDLPVTLTGLQVPAPWNLAMIDLVKRPPDQAYAYPDSSGSGVSVYVIDTGIVSNNPQLDGRVLPGVSFVDGDASTSDCYGHGTHVAGTIASTSYGVAKLANVVPVRVFNCAGGGATETKVIKAIDWAIANKPEGTAAVINMSLGLECSWYCSSLPMLTAVQRAVAANFVVVVSAGNSGLNACTFAPAAAPSALTVGAVNKSDLESTWSNFGPCVDLYAPGVDVVSLNYRNASGSATMSGTSMAAPHVAGAAALYIAANPGMPASEITQALKESAGSVPIVSASGHAGSPNAQLTLTPLLSSSSVGVAPGAPIGLIGKAYGVADVDLSWVAATSYAPVRDYLVSYRRTGEATWTTFSSPASPDTTRRVSGLERDTNYEFRVQAKTDMDGPYSSGLSVKTLSGIPEKPSQVTAGTIQATSLALSWSSPLANGSSISDFELQYRASATMTWETSAHAPSSSPSLSVSRLTPAKSYDFRVRAVSPFGAGPWSSTTTVSTLSGIPRAPDGLKATTVLPTSATIVWAAPKLNGAPLRDYTIEYKRNVDSVWIPWDDGVSTFSSTTITGLKPGTTLNVRVSAKTDFGTSSSSAVTSFTTKTGVPLKVSSLSASPARASLSLNWSPAIATGAPVRDYVIEYRASTVSTWTRLRDAVTPIPHAYLNGLLPNTTYFVRVVAVSAFGESTPQVQSVRTLP
jgi:hypothetical protein